MVSEMCKVVLLFVALILFANVFDCAEGTYRKPPFNGSIFGKRNAVNQEYDSASKTLSALCEIANEACQAWFPLQEK